MKVDSQLFPDHNCNRYNCDLDKGRGRFRSIDFVQGSGDIMLIRYIIYLVENWNHLHATVPHIILGKCLHANHTKEIIQHHNHNGNAGKKKGGGKCKCVRFMVCIQ